MSKFTKISDLASWAVALLCLAFLGVLWAGIVVELQLYRGRVIEREFRHNDNLVKIFAEQVNRSFRAAETTLADIANSYLRLGDGFDLVGYFTDRKLHLDPARSLAILDDKGDLVLSNLPLQRRLNFAESAHIRRHSTNPSTDILIGPPVLGAITGKWTMFLSRRISRTDGGYAGSALYGVDTDHFRDLFRELDLGADASYALVGLDGIARSRNIDGNPDTGMDYRQSPLFHADLKKAKSGHFLRPSPRDGVMRLTSYTVLERYGMVVLFALTEDAALAEYRIDRQKYLKVGAGGTVLILVLGLVALVLLRRAALAEERHKTSEDRLALVENAIHDGVWDWEIATGSDYLSPHWKALLGYRDEELPNVAATFSDRLHPDDAAPTRAALNSHFETGTPFSMELRLRHRDGGYRWFLTRGEALRDAAGKPYRMIGGLTDIDARKRSEETLARTQAQLTSMIDSAMDAIITVDDRMRIVGFNLSASRLFNCKREDAIGLALEGFIPTRYRGEHEGQMRAFAESGATKRSMGHGAEVTAVRADGTEFAADISISSYIGSGHRFYTAIIRDITQRKLSEAMVKQGLIDLAAAKEAAEVANRSKSAFLANMSHELRTPLNAIIGFAEVIAKGGGGLGAQKSAEYANDIVESGRHLLAVLGDILDMSKIEAGRYRLHPQPVALAAIIKAALAIAGGLAKERDIIVESHIAPNLPPIEADERALKQVLLNLLSNAVKFNRPGGRIDMRLDLLASGEQEIRVADTGIGIAAEALEHLFQPFQQVDSGLTRRNEGTGLGLWISLQFVKMHGGTLHLESAPGIGTTAVLRLPVGHKPNQDNTIGPSITPPP